MQIVLFAGGQSRRRSRKRPILPTLLQVGRQLHHCGGNEVLSNRATGHADQAVDKGSDIPEYRAAMFNVCASSRQPVSGPRRSGRAGCVLPLLLLDLSLRRCGPLAA